MKKIFIAIVLTIILMVTGCTSNKDITEKQKATKVVYCNDCGKESNEVTKFCSECGVEAKWVAEKPKKIEKIEKEINNAELLTCLNCKKEISNLEKENLKGYCQDCVTCDNCGFIPDKIDSIDDYEFDFETQLCNQCALESFEDTKVYSDDDEYNPDSNNDLTVEEAISIAEDYYGVKNDKNNFISANSDPNYDSRGMYYFMWAKSNKMIEQGGNGILFSFKLYEDGTIVEN